MKRIFCFLIVALMVALCVQAQTTDVALLSSAAIQPVGIAGFFLILVVVFLAALWVTWLARKRRKLGMSPVSVITIIEQILDIAFPAVLSILTILKLDTLAEYIGIAQSISLVVITAALAIAKLLSARKFLFPLENGKNNFMR